MQPQDNRKFIVAIDGYSSCGKSTFARAIAARLGYIFIDTGAMYRAVTLSAIRRGVLGDRSAIVAMLDELIIGFAFNEARECSEVTLNGEVVEEAIRTMEVSDSVSAVSAIEEVRTMLVAQQQMMGAAGGVVMDGRDIGTVVFPSAQIKIFMYADPAVRGARRYEELRAKGDTVTLEQVVESVKQRDHADETRSISPLRRAEDALLLDNSAMSVAEQMVWFDDLYNSLI